MKNPSPGENVQVERQGFTGIQNKRQQTSTKICGDGLFSWGSWQRLFQAPAVCSTPVTPACVKKAGLRHHLRMFGFSVPIFYFGNFPATPNKVELTADRSGQFWLGGGQESKPYQHKPTDPKRYYFGGALFKHQNNQKRAPQKISFRPFLVFVSTNVTDNFLPQPCFIEDWNLELCKPRPRLNNSRH